MTTGLPGYRNTGKNSYEGGISYNPFGKIKFRDPLGKTYGGKILLFK